MLRRAPRRRTLPENAMQNGLTAELKIQDKVLQVPVIVGTEDEQAIDIAQLRAKTGYVTLDPAFMNTGVDDERDHLPRRREGHPALPRHPDRGARRASRRSSRSATCSSTASCRPRPSSTRSRRCSRATRCIHEDMKHFFDGFPSTAHPMAILSAMVLLALELLPRGARREEHGRASTSPSRACSPRCARSRRSRTRSRSASRSSTRRTRCRYCANFLHMMFAVPAEPYEIDEDIVKALNLLLILHADHEQNCSTSTVRMVGSSQANLFASISAGICALWGPLHGGANQEVIEMLEEIRADGGDVEEVRRAGQEQGLAASASWASATASTRTSTRARRSSRRRATRCSRKLGIKDPLLDIAKALEEAALKDRTSSSASSTRTSTSTAASSTARSASRRTCSR